MQEEIFLVRSTVLSGYRNVAESLSIDVANLVSAAGLDESCLDDPDIPLPSIKVIKLIEMSAIACGASDFGIRLTLARGIPDIGPLSLLLREEPDLQSALRSLQRYLPAHSRSLRVTFDEINGLPILSTNFAVVAEPFAAYQSTEMVVCALLQAVRWLVGERWQPARICFAHAGPANRKRHAALLGCRVEFDHNFDGLVLRPRDLALPIAQATPQLRVHAERYVRSLAPAADEKFKDAVAALIGALLPLGRCSAHTIALHLGVDRSTLARRLRKQELSFSELLKRERTRLARQACLAGRPIAVIADELGFASPSTFARWFAGTFGRSTTKWRQQQSRQYRAGTAKQGPH
jgi:AraC-like DNA-binding protein